MSQSSERARYVFSDAVRLCVSQFKKSMYKVDICFSQKLPRYVIEKEKKHYLSVIILSHNAVTRLLITKQHKKTLCNISH